MKEAIVIIGAQYGDEGKGLLTSYYCEEYKDQTPIVVRFGGSAQAGHTVIYNGVKHIFSHFGSGTLQGVRTYLSSEFVCHPMLFRKESEALIKKGITPLISVDPDCEVTTPYDMLFNQLIEDIRGVDRHGSCGVGFGATVDRAQNISLKAGDLLKSNVRSTLSSILKYYYRLVSELYGPSVDAYFTQFRAVSIDKFLDDCDYFYDNIHYTNTKDNFLKDCFLILEGSQGLLLDPNYGAFPHVTRKSVGAATALSFIKTLPQDYMIHLNYLTRAYITRHGNGPLRDQDDAISQVFNIVDNTNVHNKYQGNVRYAPFSLERFNKQICQDYLTIANKGNYVKISKIMTCVDQITENSPIPFNIETEFNIISRGPSCTDVEKLF